MRIDSTMIGWLVACGLCLVSIGLIHRFKTFFNTETSMTEGSIGRGLIRFTIPLFIGNIFEQFFNLADSMIVGKYAGKNALGAIVPSGFIFFLLVSLAMGVSMGAGTIASQAFGGKKFDVLRRVADTAYVFAFLSSVVIMVAGYFLAPLILGLMNTPAEILPEAVACLRIMFYGIVFLFGYLTVSGLLRSVGDSVTPLMFLIFSTAVNIILDLVFVAGFRWGVQGAAWATFIAQAISCTTGLIYTRSLDRDALRFRIRGLTFDFGIFKRMLAIGLPTGGRFAFMSISMLALMRIVNEYGSDATAAYGAVDRLETVIVLPGIGMSMALSTFVAQNIGAGKLDRIRPGMWFSLAIAAGITAIFVAIVIPLRYQFMGLFVNASEARTIDIGAGFFMVVGWFYPVTIASFLIAGAISGTGRTLFVFISSVITQLVLRIPLAYLLRRHLGIEGIWWSIPISWVIALILTVAYWSSGVLKKSLHDPEHLAREME